MNEIKQVKLVRDPHKTCAYRWIKRNSIRLMFLMAIFVLPGLLMSSCKKNKSENSPVPIPPQQDCAPIQPDITNDVVKLRNYLYNLNRNNWSGGVIIGQQVGTPELVVGDKTSFGSYKHVIEGLYEVSGKKPGLIGVEYEYTRTYSPAELKGANVILKKHWNCGGIVTVGWSPTNPWGTAQDWSDINTTKPTNADLNELLPGGSKRGMWLAKLDNIAEGLKDLKEAGVVVLFRPMQEMNNTVFWWAKNVNTNGQAPGNFPHDDYKKVWIDMYNYLTNTKALNNLLWVFSPAVRQSFSSFPYPGDAYVDIVAGTYYTDGGIDQYGSPALPGYNDFLAYSNKAIGQAEWGRDVWNASVQGDFDYRKYLDEVSKNYPKLPFFMIWGNWQGVKMAIVDNMYAKEFMNDPRSICLGDPRLKWR
jgi:mannan endo-1,4-beta-mannosidase